MLSPKLTQGLLLFAAVIPTFYKVRYIVEPVFDQDQYVTCATDIAKNCTLDYVTIPNTTAFLSSNYYNKSAGKIYFLSWHMLI